MRVDKSFWSLPQTIALQARCDAIGVQLTQVIARALLAMPEVNQPSFDAAVEAAMQELEAGARP